MRVGDLDIAVDRTRVEVRRGGELIGRGRWDGRTVEERTGTLGSASDDDALWNTIAAVIVADEEAALAAAESDSHDADGVDLTLIDWMLTLSPTERLRVLMRHAAALAPFVRDDLRGE